MSKITYALLLCHWLLASTAFAQNPSKEAIIDFVSRTYIHGIPYDDAKALGKGAVPELISMLNDPQFESHWPNIVSTLGYIGDSSAVTPLKQLIENSKGEISISRFRACIRSFLALGHIAQTGNKEAMNILKDYTDINSWQKKKLQFRYKQYTDGTLSEALARQAIAGLGISGKPEAMQKLTEIKMKKETRKDWKDNLDAAMSTNERVKKLGPKQVFGKQPR